MYRNHRPVDAGLIKDVQETVDDQVVATYRAVVSGGYLDPTPL